MYRNNNKVFSSFQFKSPYTQKLLSESEQDHAEPNVMRKRKWPILAALIILLIIAVCTLPWTHRVVQTLEMAEVSPDGTMIASGEFTLQGKEYDYLFRQDKFKLDALQVPNHEIGKSIDQAYPIVQTHLGLFRTHIWVELPEYTSENNWYIGTLVYPEDRSWLLLQITDWTFIGSAQEHPDYARILEQCRPFL